MTSVSVTKGPHDCHLVGKLAKQGEMMAESDTGQASFHFPEHGPVLGRSGHFRIEGLDVRRPALEIKKYYGLVPENFVAVALGTQGPQAEQIRQGKSAKTERPYAKELPAGATLAGRGNFA